MSTSEQHFDEIAKEYDYWKSKNWYYYQNLKALYRSFIPLQSKVWEIGCGTGDILAYLEPSDGYGTDISQEMINIANKKHGNNPNLKYGALDIIKLNEIKNYEYIFMADVLEHVEDLNGFFAALKRITKPGVKIIISVANPLWEPVLMLSEKLGMKMPEGPHWRLSIKQNEEIFRKNGFKIKEKGYRLLIPKKLPGSDWVNIRFSKIPVLSKMGFVIYWVLLK